MTAKLAHLRWRISAWSAARRGIAAFAGLPPTARLGLAIVAFWVAVAACAPWIAPYNPNINHVEGLQDPVPSWTHPLGLDSQGRDILSRIVFGARTVLTVAPIAVLAATLLGASLGLLAGYYRGWVDSVISRICDLTLSLPTIIFYFVVLSALGASALNIVLVIAITKAPMTARIVRGLTLELVPRDYVSAAKMRGESAWFIMACELLPNMRGPLLIEMCLRLGYTIITIGMLGFLGLGLPPPDPDWGSMVNDARKYIYSNPLAILWPSLAIATLVIGVNLFADGLREEITRYQR